MTQPVRLRLLAAVVASAFIALASPGPVAAKFPYFSVELHPAEPQPGEPITVSVRTWADAGHSQPSGFTYESTLTDLVEFQRMGAGSGPTLVPVALQMIEPDVFRAQVTLPAGEWRLVAFPHGRGAGSDFGPGYPQPMSVVVPDQATWPAWLAVGLASGAVGAAVAVGVRMGRIRVPRERIWRRSTPVPQDTNTDGSAGAD